MIVAFFESIKYVGHILPLSFLRVYMGYYYFDKAIDRYTGEFLVQPQLAAAIDEWLKQSQAPEWYIELIYSIVHPYPNWKIFAYIITYCEFLIGLSLVLGFLVRPFALVGILLTLNFYYISGPHLLDLNKLFLALFIVMWWMGAGRCMGFDYFFFKRQRGIWW